MSLSIATNEKIVIKLLIGTPDNVLKFDKNYFISKIAQDLFTAIKNAYIESFDLTVDNLLIFGNKINSQITKELISNLLEIQVEEVDFNKYFKQLKKDYAKNRIEFKILKDTLIETSRKGDLNIEKIEGLRNEINECLDIIEGKESLLISPVQMFDAYKKAITLREKGGGRYQTGDSYLDSHLTMGFAPGQITLIYGGQGEGKSIFALHLIIKQINKEIPNIYISLENDEIMTTDRIMAIRNNICFSELFNSSEGVSEEIYKTIEEEKEKFKNINAFYFVKETNLSISDIESLVKESKRKMNTDYLVCTIDLLTMVREFSKDISASNIEEAINELHKMARRQNIHIVAVVQANTSNDFKPKEISEVWRCRPNLKQVKNSKALAERSRIVLSIFRPKIYAETYFGKDNPKVEIMDDTLEIRVEKQNQGPRGAVLHYLFIGETFKLYKYVKEEKENQTPPQ